MSARGIVPAFDELEAGNAGFGLGFELSPVEQFAFERGEEALAHGVVVAIADRAHRRAHAHFLAPEAEGHGCVLGGFNRSSQHPVDGGVDDKNRQTKIRTFDPGQIKLTRKAASLAT